MERSQHERGGAAGRFCGLVLHADLEGRLEEWARNAAPREACGLLLGRREGSLAVVVEVVELPNLAHGTDRFRLDPAGHLAAERRAEGAGQAVLGVWHNHPSGDSRPSSRDLTGTPPGWCQLVLGRSGPVETSPRAWHRVGLDLRELQLIRPPAPEGLQPRSKSVR